MMTGKDLIIYILENDLLDEPIVKDDKFIGVLRPAEVAVKLNVGIETVYAYIGLGKIDYVVIGGSVFIPANYKLK